MMRSPIDPTSLRQLLRYEPDTGQMFWNVRPASMFPTSGRGGSAGCAARWNACHANAEAFCAVNSRGYRTGTLLNAHAAAHRVAWTLFYGEWPSSEIDHVNGNRADNRISNLRSATPQQNACNRGMRSDNKSGVKGVSWFAASRKWKATIAASGRQHYLGLFHDIADAERAVLDARATLHGLFGRAA